MTHYTSLLQTPCALREGFSSSLMECLLEGGLLQPAPQGHYADARLLSGLLFRAVPEKLVNHYSGDGTLDDSVGVSPMKAVGTVQFAPAHRASVQVQWHGRSGRLRGRHLLAM